MITKLKIYASAAKNMPMGLFLAKSLRKLGVNTTAVRRWELLSSRAATRPGRLCEIFLERFADAERRGIAPELSFPGKHLLELGCGPLGGLGVAATLWGCTRYTGVDPALDEVMLRSGPVARNYLAPAFSETARILDVPVPDDAATRFGDVSRFSSAPAHALGDLDMPVDIVVSISCLEHIEDLETTFRRLAALSNSEVRHFHVVNFSNHTSKDSPFSDIYEAPPEVYKARFGNHINLWRAPDLARIIADAGLDLRVHPLDRRPELLARATIAPWWRDRYSEEDLAVRTALVVN